MESLLILCLSLLPAHAAGAAAPLSAQSYNLRNLSPVGLTMKSGADKKALLQFQNDQGNQFLLYEESSGAAPVREIAALIPFMASPGHICSVELDCKTKAFCTNDCKNLYYEVSNLSPEKTPAGRNHCLIKSFSCSLERGLAATPAPASPTPPSMPAPAAEAKLIPLPATPLPAPGPSPSKSP